MVLDISGLFYFIPILSFLLVFVIIYALLTKTKILGEEAPFTNSLISFVIAIIFVTFSSIRQYIETVTPWFAVLIVALFFILMLIGFSQKKMEDMMKPPLAWIFIILLIVVFIVSAVVVFGDILGPYLPGQPHSGTDPFLLKIASFIFSSRFLGAFLLLIVAIIVSYVLTKK